MKHTTVPFINVVWNDHSYKILYIMTEILVKVVRFIFSDILWMDMLENMWMAWW